MNRFLFSLVLILMCFFNPIYAASKGGSKIFSLQLSTLGVVDQIGNVYLTLHPAWTPYISLANAFGLRGFFGYTILRGTTTFAATNAELLLAVGNRVQLEAGGGYEKWLGQGAGGLKVTSNLVYVSASGVTRYFVGFSHFNKPTKGPVQEFRAGLGF